MAYTYDDFVKAAQDAGLWEEFSADDLALAQQNAQAGFGLLSAKKQYHAATDDMGRQLANAAANGIRQSYGNYNGGDSGQNYSLGPLSPAAQNQNPLQGEYLAMLDQVKNRQPFDYDYSKDPVWQAYKGQYEREGTRAMQDTLAQVSARTGGLASSYAGNAAQQTYNSYMQALTDKIPELYENAYNKYLNEYQMQMDLLNATGSARDREYQTLLDTIAQQNQLRSENIENARYQDETGYNRQQDQRDWLLNLIAMGVDVSDEDLAAAGMTREQAQAMAAYYAGQSSGRSGGSGYGGSTGTGTGTSGDKWAEMRRQMDLGVDPESYITEHYKDLGYSSKAQALAAWENLNVLQNATGEQGTRAVTNYGDLMNWARFTLQTNHNDPEELYRAMVSSGYSDEDIDYIMAALGL